MLAILPCLNLILIPPNKEELKEISQSCNATSLNAKVGPWDSSSKWILLSLSSVTVGVTLGTLKVEYDLCIMSLREGGEFRLVSV